MANPNIVNVTEIKGEVSGAAVTTSFTALVPVVATNHVAKVNALYVSNVDGTSAQEITVVVNNGTTDFAIASTISVPADATIDVLSKSIYLKEGWSLKVKAGRNSALQAVASWEDLTA